MGNFKIGDRVEVIKELDSCKKGFKGVVKVLNPHFALNIGLNIGVEFDNEFKNSHSLEGYSTVKGYWLNENSLKIIPTKKEIEKEEKAKKRKEEISFKPGMTIRDYVKKQLKHSTGEKKKWLRTFDNCILPEDVRDTINDALTIVLRSDVFESWGLNEHFEKGVTNSILIYGASGTGKSMVCESISAVLDKNLMKLDSGTIQSNIPGQTERNIEESFKKAAAENCVLLLDECDSLLYNRDSVGAIMSSEINKLLTEIENFAGVVLLTTNRLHKLDSALQRRIIAKIELPLPNEKIRRQIWEKLMPAKMPVKHIDIKKLAKADLSGGEIKNCILLAARKSIARNKDHVTMEEFNTAITSILQSKKDYNDVHPDYQSLNVDSGQYQDYKKVSTQ